jgi:hypothetical protein
VESDVGILIDRGKLEPINSRTSFPEVEGIDVENFRGSFMEVYLVGIEWKKVRREARSN